MKGKLTGSNLLSRKEINQNKLSLENLKRKLSYNPETGLFTRNCLMPGSGIGAICGTTKASGYVIVCVDRTLYRAHRLAWFYQYGRWPIGDVDHINRVRSDNRIANLREASRSDNLCNSSIRSDNKCGIRGVSFNKLNRNYTVKIEKNGELLVKHGINTLEEAEYLAAAFIREMHGRFASC